MPPAAVVSVMRPIETVSSDSEKPRVFTVGTASAMAVILSPIIAPLALFSRFGLLCQIIGVIAAIPIAIWVAKVIRFDFFQIEAVKWTFGVAAVFMTILLHFAGLQDLPSAREAPITITGLFLLPVFAVEIVAYYYVSIGWRPAS